MSYKRLIGIAGATAWIMVGLPAFIYHAGAPPTDGRWVTAFLLFGIAFSVNLARARLALLLAESAAAIALILFRCNGYEGTLLVVLAMQLGARLGRISGLTWIGVQTLLLGVTVSMRVSPRAALLLAPAYLGFQALAFFVFHIMAREVTTRTELAMANAELRAMQQVLADRSRMAERLRIAHELHDALGHRLTVLSLNLEVALQCAEGALRARVEMCQSLARDLLNDVRDIVVDARTPDGVPITEVLGALVRAVPRPHVHLQVAEALRMVDPEGIHILLRCVQEILTNAARHSGAKNLWIDIEQDSRGVRLQAHDDGHGSNLSTDGFGLLGMRERVRRAGGEIQFFTQPGRGFGVTAMLPMRSGAA